LYPLQASFAQPSGISLGDSNEIYIADAESSSIRVLNLDKGYVKSICGGDLEPDNLFAYGDVDGIGHEAKLQHPLDVAYVKQKDAVYLVDTYNSSLKRVNLKTKYCQKMVNESSLELNEPSGIWVDENTIWIADSNNHSIKFIENFDTENNSYKLNEFLIQFEDTVDHIDNKVTQISLNNQSLKEVQVKFKFDINEEADNSCKINSLRKNKIKEETLVHLKKLPNENIYKLDNFNLNTDELVEINFQFNLIICTQSDTGAEICKMVKKAKNFKKKEILKVIEKNKDALVISIE
jgi:hypothetical protein